MIEPITKSIKNKKSEIIKFCQKLVKTPSQNGIENEKEIAQVISKRLKQLKIKHRLIGSKERPSILAKIGKKGKKRFILSAHLDTVPIGEKKFWSHDPFSGKIVKGKLYGRGSADCKAGIAAAIYAANCLKNLNLDGQLILAFDSDEESGNFTGMKTLLKKGLKGDVCLITYPGNGEVMIGSRGVLRSSLTTFGEAVHTGSRTQKGINAINKMAKVIQVLENLKLRYKSDKFFPFGPKLTVSTIKGGLAINIVPDRCEIEIDIRTLPFQTREEILEQITRTVAKQIPDLKFSIDYFVYHPAYRIPENSKIIKIILNRSKQILKKEPKIACAGTGTSGSLLWQKGIPTICGFGVDFENLHSYDECIYVKSLIDTAILYAHIIYDFLKEN
ncbi:MAG: ArgE/DapE family deacylase [Patescibacteria group bacterium]|nr:ArgE/DapE family deacylase [Patescibacteria group bacterium]